MTDKEYTRAQIYYWQVAKVLDFLPPVETNFRLVSVFWGLLSIVLVFLAGYFYSSRNFLIALLSAFLWAISIASIGYSRHFRMYSMFAPVYLILSYFVYQFLEAKINLKKQNFLYKLSQKTQLNWYYFIPALFFLVISFLTHFLTINIFSTVGVYVLFLATYEWKKTNNWKNKYSWLLLIPLISLILL